ncbi:hypothetical protein PoB_002685600, partial [Plakobranchus ocellatus]
VSSPVMILSEKRLIITLRVSSSSSVYTAIHRSGRAFTPPSTALAERLHRHPPL